MVTMSTIDIPTINYEMLLYIPKLIVTCTKENNDAPVDSFTLKFARKSNKMYSYL